MATFEEKLAQFDEKTEERKRIRKNFIKQNRKSENKKNQKRLAEIGAIVEKTLGQKIEIEMLPAFEKFLQEQENRGKFLSKAVIASVYEETI